MLNFAGCAYVFGDDINTDYIIASRRKRDTIDNKELAQFLMEDIRPGFGQKVIQGNILVAGKNFGCGAAMEVASLVIQAAGIPVVLAKSFARTFYRNGINGGLVLIKCNTDGIEENDELTVTVTKGNIKIVDNTKNVIIPSEEIPDKLTDYLLAGGLISYLNRDGSI